VENECCAKHRQLVVPKHEKLRSNNFISSATASQSGLSSFDPYGLSSDDEEYSTPENVAKTTPGQCDCAALSLTAARLYSNWPPKSQKNWGQFNPNLNDYHSDPMEIGRTYTGAIEYKDWSVLLFAGLDGELPIHYVNLPRSLYIFWSILDLITDDNLQFVNQLTDMISICSSPFWVFGMWLFWYTSQFLDCYHELAATV